MAAVSGYAIQWGQPANIANLFIERFARGAFDKHLAKGEDVACLWGHDMTRPLGRTGNGTLTLRSDNVGLWFSCELTDGSPLASEAAAMIGNETVKEMSVGFFAVKEEWDDSGTLPQRLITEAGLIEVSAVVYGAYSAATSVSLGGAGSSASRTSTSVSRAAAKMRARGINV